MLIGGVKSGHLSVETLWLVGPENGAWVAMEKSPDQSSGCFPTSLAHTQHSTTHSSFSTRLQCLSHTRGHHSMWQLFFPLPYVEDVLKYIRLSLTDLCSLCLDGIAFIAIRTDNIIMVSPHNRGLLGFFWEALCLHGCFMALHLHS